MKPHLSEFFSVWFIRFLLGFERPYSLSDFKNIHAFLLVIIFFVKLLSVFCKNAKVQEVKPVKQVKKAVNKMTDINDEDMMVAALIATIDYANETKKDVRLVSIKQIG